MASISWPPWAIANFTRMQDRRWLMSWRLCPTTTTTALAMRMTRKICRPMVVISTKVTWILPTIIMRIWSTIRQWPTIGMKTSRRTRRQMAMQPTIAAAATATTPTPQTTNEMPTVTINSSREIAGMTHYKCIRRMQMVMAVVATIPTATIQIPITIAFKTHMPNILRPVQLRRPHNNQMHCGMHFTTPEIPGISMAFQVAISDCTVKTRIRPPLKRTTHTIIIITTIICSTSITIWWSRRPPMHKMPIKVCFHCIPMYMFSSHFLCEWK